MLGHGPVRAGQQQSVVAGEGTGAPGLGAVDDPLTVLVVRPGDDAGEVGTATGFAQQLHQDLVATDGGRDPFALLLFASHIEECRGADRERRHIQDQRHLVGAALDVEGFLVGVIQAEAAVLAWKADPGEAALVEPLLQLLGAVPVFLLGAHRERWIVGGRHVACSRPATSWRGRRIRPPIRWWRSRSRCRSWLRLLRLRLPAQRVHGAVVVFG